MPYPWEHAMRGLVLTSVVLWLVAAVVGTVVPGLFWLTLVSLAGLLLTGAVGVSTIPAPAEGGASPVGRRPRLSMVGSIDGPGDRGGSQDGGELSRAA